MMTIIVAVSLLLLFIQVVVESFVMIRQYPQHQQQWRKQPSSSSSSSSMHYYYHGNNVVKRYRSLLYDTSIYSMKDSMNAPHQQQQQQYPNIPKNVKLLILPGFGNAYQDYILPKDTNNGISNNTNSSTLVDNVQQQLTEYRIGSLLQSLQQRGWEYNTNVYILPIQRWEWIKVFLYGLFDIQFLLYSTAPPTNPPFLWYLQHIQHTIQERMIPKQPKVDDNKPTTTTTTNDDDDDEITNIVFIGHSAGGWLGRAAIGYLIQQQQQQVNKQFMYRICGLITLGTPNLPPPPNEMDMTRGALRYTDTTYPGAYQHYQQQQQTDTDNNNNNTNNKNNTIFYITVCGNTIQGKKQDRQRWNEPTTVSGFAYNSYKAVCGNGTEIGDGVVPICSSHLINATQQITLPNIYHSINVPEQWYGTDTVIDTWYIPMMEQIHHQHCTTDTATRTTTNVNTTATTT